MYSDEISACLSGLSLFEGVFALDTLPVYVLRKPSIYIVNLDKSSQGGSHWCAIYFNSNGGAFWFDSFGLYPIKKEIEIFLFRNCQSWTFNSKQLQSINSDVCGQAVCVFTKYVEILRNVLFLELFDKDPFVNSVIICRLFNLNFACSVERDSGIFCRGIKA